MTANEEGQRMAHIVESTVVNLLSGEEAFVGEDFVMDPKLNVCHPLGRKSVSLLLP